MVIYSLKDMIISPIPSEKRFVAVLKFFHTIQKLKPSMDASLRNFISKNQTVSTNSGSNTGKKNIKKKAQNELLEQWQKLKSSHIMPFPIIDCQYTHFIRRLMS